MPDRRELPYWYKHDQPEYHRNEILYACASAGMTSEQALDTLAKAYLDLRKRAQRIAELSNRPLIIKVDQPSGELCLYGQEETVPEGND